MTQWQAVQKTAAGTAVMMLCAFALPLRAHAQAKPYSIVGIVKLLVGDVAPKRVEVLARQRGIDFEVTNKVEKELRRAGATGELVAALRSLSPKPLTPGNSHATPQRPQAASVGVVGGVPGGTPGGVTGGIISGGAPPPPPPTHAATPKRILLGGQVESAKLIFHPNPEYPILAKTARIQGTVRLEAIISKDGTIQELKALDGHPFLIKAAMDAVSHWRYEPTLLNNEPVEVVTEVDVNFTLSE